MRLDFLDVDTFLDTILVFKYEDVLVRGMFYGTDRSHGRLRWVLDVGPQGRRCYDINLLEKMTFDLAPWSSEEQRHLSLGEFQ